MPMPSAISQTRISPDPPAQVSVPLRPALSSKPPVSVSPSPEVRRSSLLDTAAFSPVNENGCFEFDRIIMSGVVWKKGRKTKNYKQTNLVLRPLSVSVYSDAEHTRLRHRILLADVTAVARRRQTKRSRAAVFTIFTPARNFHFDTREEAVADAWVEAIRAAARVDEWEEGAVASSEDDGEPAATAAAAAARSAPRSIPGRRPSSSAAGHPSLSAPDGMSAGSFSSISSLGAANFRGSAFSLVNVPSPEQPKMGPRTMSTAEAEMDQERVLRNGRLHLLKGKGGVKKWKPVWAVLRAKSLAIYPNEQEYSPLLIIPFPSIVNAVEIDSPSRNKKRQFCMQVITEERNWRFCAQDEDDLTRWLGSLKSLLAKRRAAEEVPLA